MKTKPSSTQKEALKMIAADGGYVARVKGGFWISGKPSAFDKTTGAPDIPWCGTPTVNALVSRGWIERTNQFAEAWRDIYRLTESGREIANA